MTTQANEQRGYRDPSQRVVVTGMGAITPLGNTVDEYWAGLVAGRSGIVQCTRFRADGYPCRIVGEVNDFDPRDTMDAKDARRMARASQFAVASAREALADAGFTPETTP